MLIYAVEFCYGHLTGGAGADTIYGGAGNDVITGGAGSDTFVFNSDVNDYSATADVVTDFNTVEDVIQLSATELAAAGHGWLNNFTSNVDFTTLVVAANTDVSIAGADLFVWTGDNTTTTSGAVDALMASMTDTSGVQMLVMTDDGTNTYLWLDEHANAVDGVQLIGTFNNVNDASEFTLANFNILA